MEGHTFRSRLVTLVQKSRKAVRLYSGIEKSAPDAESELRELQIGEWKSVTTDLLRQLTACLENPHTKRLSADVYSLRDRYYNEWRMIESELHVSQRDLIAASESSDFVRACLLSKKLVALKARVQAAQAAHHELHDVIQKGRVSEPAIELSGAQVIEPAPEPQLTHGARIEDGEGLAKVIPLRKRRILAAS